MWWETALSFLGVACPLLIGALTCRHALRAQRRPQQPELPDDVWDWLEPHLALCEGRGVWMKRPVIVQPAVIGPPPPGRGAGSPPRFIDEMEMIRRLQPPIDFACPCTDCKTTHDKVAFIERYGPE